MSLEDEHDEALLELEKTLGNEYDDPFEAVEAAMDVKEFLKTIAGNKEKLVALFADVEITDDQCKTLFGAIVKATALEGISLDGVIISPIGLALAINGVTKHGKIRHLNIGSHDIQNDKVAKILADFVESTTTLQSLNISYCEFSPQGVKILLEALKKNTSLTLIISTAEDESVAHQIDEIMERNKKAKSRPLSPGGVPRAATSPVTLTPPMVSNTPTASKVLSVWFKGQVHIGDNPPNEPGWTRFTFDSGTTFTGGTPASSPPSTPPVAAVSRQAAPQAPIAAAAVKAQLQPTKSTPAPVPITVAAPKSTAEPVKAAPAAVKPTGPKVLFRGQALYTYVPQDPDEVAFTKGDIVSVTKKIDEDWYIGIVERTGASGQVPANHLKPIWNCRITIYKPFVKKLPRGETLLSLLNQALLVSLVVSTNCSKMGNLIASMSSTTPHHVHKVSLCSSLAKAAETYPDKLATIDGTREKTWKQVKDRVENIARGLVENGLKPEDRVCLLGLNSDYYFEVMFAVSWAGGIVVPLNFRLSPQELNHVIKDSGASFLLVDETFQKSTLPQLDVTTIQHVLPIGIAGAGVEVFASATGGNSLPMSPRGNHDIYGIFYTGGTTGKAKGAMLTHVGLFTASLGSLWLNEFSSETRFLHTAPMFHLADAQMVFTATLATSIHVFSPRFVPPEFLPLMARYSINKVVLIPVMLHMILNLPNLKDDPVQKEAVAKMRAVPDLEFIYGGSVLPEPVLKGLRDLFPQARLFAGFGMTEMSPGIAFLSNKDHEDPKLIASIGRSMPWVEVRICDTNDQPVKRGEFGELQARGANMMLGYWNLPGVSAETLKGGWMHTGDAARMDENGYLYLGDRIKDMIKSGGENVFSLEVEKVIATHPKIAMGVVIGMPDPVLGEKVVAVVTLKDPKNSTLEVAELKEFCTGKLAPYKVPKEVKVQEALPMSGAGKILKHEIRKSLGAVGAKSGEAQKTNYQ